MKKVVTKTEKCMFWVAKIASIAGDALCDSRKAPN
jgi:hypothetical protein